MNRGKDKVYVQGGLMAAVFSRGFASFRREVQIRFVCIFLAQNFSLKITFILTVEVWAYLHYALLGIVAKFSPIWLGYSMRCPLFFLQTNQKKLGDHMCQILTQGHTTIYSNNGKWFSMCDTLPQVCPGLHRMPCLLIMTQSLSFDWRKHINKQVCDSDVIISRYLDLLWCIFQENSLQTSFTYLLFLSKLLGKMSTDHNPLLCHGTSVENAACPVPFSNMLVKYWQCTVIHLTVVTQASFGKHTPQAVDWQESLSADAMFTVQAQGWMDSHSGWHLAALIDESSLCKGP